MQIRRQGNASGLEDATDLAGDGGAGGNALSDSEGRYRFKTIKPGAYPAGPNLIRPSHIHFQVTGRQDRLVTQLYFEGDPYNATDPFLNSAPVKNILITKMLDPSPEFEPGSKMVLWDIVLYKG